MKHVQTVATNISNTYLKYFDDVFPDLPFRTGDAFQATLLYFNCGYLVPSIYIIYKIGVIDLSDISRPKVIVQTGFIVILLT